MDPNENTGLLSGDPAAAHLAGDSSMHLASAPSDSVTRGTDGGGLPSAPPLIIHPLLTQALVLIRRGNNREAIPLLEKASADGCAEADVELTECFGLGWGAPPNPARAFQHATRSASHGILEGRYMAAWCVPMPMPHVLQCCWPVLAADSHF